MYVRKGGLGKPGHEQKVLTVRRSRRAAGPAGLARRASCPSRARALPRSHALPGCNNAQRTLIIMHTTCLNSDSGLQGSSELVKFDKKDYVEIGDPQGAL